MVRHAGAQRFYPADHVARWAAADPSIVSITGRIISAPKIYEPRDDVPRAYELPPKTRFLLNVESLRGARGSIPASGRAIATVKEPILNLPEGSRIAMTGWLYRIAAPQNPGVYDWAAHHRRDGILVGFSTDHAAAVTVIERPSSGGIRAVVESVRQWLGRFLIATSFPNDEESAGVVAAMVLGQRSVVSKTLNDAFVRTGNVHFLAASGMNVAWLALVGWTIARLCNINYRPTAVFIACLIVAFVVLAEPQPSILRAGIVGLIACLMIFFRGRFNSVNSIAFSAILLLLIDPADWFRAGFQLTFLATIGLLHVYPAISNLMADGLIRINRPNMARYFLNGGVELSIEQQALTPESAQHPFLRRSLTIVAQVFAISVSEWLLTAPLVCFHFNTFALWGAIDTFLVSPLAMLTAFIGFITILGGLVFPTLAGVLGPLLKFVSATMIEFVKWLASWPGTSLDGRSPSLIWLVAVYAAFAVWIYCPIQFRGRFRRPILLAFAILLAWWLAAPHFNHRKDGSLRIWTLAVGNGSATVIELPNGKTLLYDFGTRSSFDSGTIGLDFLRFRGIHEIDAAFVSHANFDHYGGIEPIAAKVPIRKLMINDQFEAFIDASSPAWHFLQKMEQMGIAIEKIRGNQRFEFCEGVHIETVWPPELNEQRSPTANDASIVLRVEYGGKSMLLCGDIADWAIGGLIARDNSSEPDVLRADALALPHHGSVVPNTGAFIERVNPAIAIRSTGESRALTINGIEQIVGPNRTYFSTADGGCIVVTIGNGKLNIARGMP
ncbi:MAG: ComEC/Rec2 family competence protein [Planctomycetes bacterium]|nr:ComEC/Rec2 family competence protein [Planctomycetota bacterium]